MLIKKYLVLIGTCLALSLAAAFFFSPLPLSAHAAIPTSGPTFQVKAGFDSRYRDGNWIPVQVSLRNDSIDFSGTLSVGVPSPYTGAGNNSYSASYQVPINLANGAQKQVTIYIPLNTGAAGAQQDIKVNLLDRSGNVVNSQVTTLHSLTTGDVLIGTLSDQSSGLSQLNAVMLPSAGSTLITESLDATNFPSVAAVLRNFDIIVIDNFSSSSLSKDQLTALQTWINQGGALIIAGGPEWKRTVGALPSSLVPVKISGTTTLPAGTTLLPVGSSNASDSKVSSSVQSPVTISTGTVQQDAGQTSTILASGTTPLIVQSRQGEGSICYLAFDPTLDPVVRWNGVNALWKSLVLRSLGDQVLPPTSGQYYGPGWKATYQQGNNIYGVLQSLVSNALPSPWLLLVLLLGYIVILGPVRFLIIRWRKRKDWSWRIVLSTVVVFSLLTYGLALYQKGSAIASNTISVVRLNQGNTSAHITSYIGVFIPDNGSFQVHVPGNNLVQTSTTNDQGGPGGSNSGQQTTVTSGQDGTDVGMQSQAFFSLRSLLAEQDQPVQGGITSHLTLQNSILSGTVTNTLSYRLTDAYVLMPNSFVSIGDLAAGETRTVKLQLNPASSGTSLADQIATSRGLTTPYGQYSSGSQPQNEFQRHMAILSAFSVVISVNGGGPATPVNSGDPLLISGAPATIIGWADQSTDSMHDLAVNGTTSSGLRETLVQAPLPIDYAGTVNLPAGFLSGQIIDIQNTNNTVQEQSPGLYAMTTGSMTFEFAIPNSPALHPGTLTISEPSNLMQVAGSINSSGSVVDVSRLTMSLYNWQTGSWDTVRLNGYTYSTNNISAYVGPGGRVLLQFANQDSSIGTAVFSKPMLGLDGTVS